MRSVWYDDAKIERREKLERDMTADVCVIGGGICGILTAYRLMEKGVATVVLEADRIGMGQTCGTTAKITLQHGYIFDKLLKQHGKERAGMYFAAAKEAIEEYAAMIRKDNISCDFEKQDSFVYTIKDKDKLIKEAAAAKGLGIAAEFVEDEKLDIPIRTLGAVKIKDQAQFHPLKFIEHISRKLNVYEETRVKRVENNRVISDRGSVTAKNIVFACHYPIVNFPGFYFTKLYTERSYVLALEGVKKVKGMYIDESGHGLSFRNYGDLLLLGGGMHRTGKEGGGYDTLCKSAEEIYPQCNIVGKWSAQDCIPPDDIPYIGRYSGNRPNWYLAAGFKKWGMTTAMTAADIISDMICGRNNEYSRLFTPQRFSLRTAGRIVYMGAEAVKGLSKQICTLPKESESDVKAGEAGKVRHEDCKCGIYNDGETIHRVTTRCSHLGCELNWNKDERSWDCPCHGSRFTEDGEVINGPAQENISRRH